MVKAAIVILNWNGLHFLKKFLGQVEERSSGKGIEIYIADNGSEDGSGAYVTLNHPQVKLLEFESNLGFAGGYNRALGMIEAEYFILLNSDIEVTEGWAGKIISYLDSNPDVAACQPKILSFENRNTFEYAGAAGGFIDKYGYPLCRGRVFSKVEADSGQYDNPIDIFWSTGACMAVRAEIWKFTGGFDPDFFAHMEEIDLCWRMHRKGFRITCIPYITVYHVGGGTLPYSSPFKTFLNFRNSLYLLYKNLPAKYFIVKMFKRMVLDGVAAMFFFIKGEFPHFHSVRKAHMAFYRNLASLRRKRILLEPEKTQNYPGLILNKIVVFEFFIRRHKTYNSLVK